MVVSTDAAAKTVVVVGITGTQGGSVARALIDSEKPYKIVGLTRDTKKPSATKWLAAGVKLREVNIVVGNEEKVKEAMAGADIVFAVTNVTEHFSFDREAAEGKLNAAKANNVELFIWSGIESVTKISKGKYTADAFKSKDDVTVYVKSIGLPWAIVIACGYASNFATGGLAAPVKQPDGSYVLTMGAPPDSIMPIFDCAKDYGKYVRAAIEVPGLGPGSEVLTGSNITIQGIADAIAKATGKTIVLKKRAKESVPEFLWAAGQACAEFGFYGDKDMHASQKAAGIVPRTFDQILAEWDGPFLTD